MSRIKISKFFVLIFLIYSYASLECGKGCLTCDFKSDPPHCLVCDVKESFIFDPLTNGCLKIQLSGCLDLQYEIKGKSNNFDQNQSKQKLFSKKDLTIGREKKLVKNSENIIPKMMTSYFCRQCEKGMIFNFQNNKCVLKNIVIDGCDYYSNNNECSKCHSDKTYLIETNECILNSELPDALLNCTRFSVDSSRCIECNSGFTLLPIKIKSPDILNFRFCVKSSSLFNLQIQKNNNSTLKKEIEEEGYTSEEIENLQMNALTSNCEEMSIYDCKECSSSSHDHHWNSTHSITLSFLRNNSPIVRAFDFNLILRPGFSISIDPPSPCEYPFISHCRKYEQMSPSFSSCIDCEDGYILKQGICLLHPGFKIENCYVYSSRNKCRQCKEGFFLIDEKTCIETFKIQNCISYDELGSCQKCENFFFLDQKDSICIPRENSLFNCILTSDFDDNCYECEDNYFLFLKENQEYLYSSVKVYYPDLTILFDDFREFSCYLRPQFPITFCLKYDIHSPACLQCEESYKLSISGFACLPIIPNCIDQVEKVTNAFSKTVLQTQFDENQEINLNDNLNIVKSSNVPLKFTCFECTEGFVPSDDKSSCESISIPNCEILSKTVNECQKCSNLFYFNIDQTDPKIYFRNEIRTKCIPMLDENCLENIPNFPLCKKCKAGFYIAPGEFLNQPFSKCMSMTEGVDSKCIASTFSEDNGGCSECLPGYISFKVYTHTNTIGHQINKGCGRFDRRTLRCLDCKANYGSKNSECDTFDSESICMKLKPFSEGTANILLSDPKSLCVACRNPKKYFLKDGSCIPRTLGISRNCAKLYSTKDNCEKCQEGFFPLESEAIVFCEPRPENWKSIKNCLTYSSNQQKCSVCIPGFKLEENECKFISTSNPKKPSEIWVPFWFQSTKKILNHKLISEINTQNLPQNLLDNCEVWIQSGNGFIECAKCKNVGLIKTDQFGYKSNLSNFNLITNKFEFFENQKTIYECLGEESYEEFIQVKYTSSLFVQNKKCLFAEKTSKGKYLCVTCVPGYESRLGTILYSSNFDDSLDTEIKGITDCIPQTDFTSKFEGLGLDDLIYQNLGKSNYSNQLEHHRVLYDSCQDSSKILMFFPSGYNGRIYQCLSKDQIKVKVENCQMYSWYGYGGVNLESQKRKNWKCLACAPGHSPIFGEVQGRDLDHIINCVPIKGCDLNSLANNWLNTCAWNALHSGYAYSSRAVNTSSLLMVSMGQIVKLNQTENPHCLISSESIILCLLCKKGYYFNEEFKKCVEIVSSQCKENGFFRNIKNKNIHISARGLLQSILGVNKILNSLYSIPRQFWEENLSSLISHIPGFMCEKCDSDSIPVNSPNDPRVLCSSILNFTPQINCRFYSTEKKFLNTGVCSECIQGMILDDTLRCQKNYLTSLCVKMKIVFNQKECTLCKEGYYLDPQTKECFPIIDSNCLIDFFGGTGEGIISNEDFYWLEGKPFF